MYIQSFFGPFVINNMSCTMLLMVLLSFMVNIQCVHVSGWNISSKFGIGFQ